MPMRYWSACSRPARRARRGSEVGFWKSLWFYVKDTFQSRGTSVDPSDGLSRTIRDASHVRGARGGLARSPSEEVLKHASEGHEDYQRSFRKNKDD